MKKQWETRFVLSMGMGIKVRFSSNHYKEKGMGRREGQQGLSKGTVKQGAEGQSRESRGSRFLKHSFISFGV